MSYPHEHEARLRDQKEFDPKSDRRTNGGTIFGKIRIPQTIAIQWGSLKDNSKHHALVQSLRFPIAAWTEATARKWIKENGIKFISFDAATEKTEPVGIMTGAITEEAIYNSPWYMAHSEFERAQKAENDKIKIQIGKKIDNGYQPKPDENGIATIPIYGALSRKGGGGFFFSLTSMELIESDFLKAMADDKIKGIVLDIDSPGGTVAGTQRLATVIRENRGKKPIVAHTGGMMASAAYYIGSAADEIVAEPSSMVGSIGVILTHADFSRAMENEGVKVTHIVAGEDKALGSQFFPLDQKAKDYFQKIVNDSYSQFVADLKLNRGDKINFDLAANGRVFSASEALDLGLIDQIGMLEEAKNITQKRGNRMDIVQLKAEYPDLCATLKAEVEAELSSKHAAEIDTLKANAETQRQAAIDGERTRRAEIRAMAAKGQEVLVDKLCEEGATKEMALAALFEDLKTRKPEEKKEEEAIDPAAKAAADALALLNGSAPAAIEKTEAETVNGVAAYEAETDPAKKTVLYQKHKSAILAKARGGK